MFKNISTKLISIRLNNTSIKNFAKYFTRQHEWIEINDNNKNTARLGISNFAQSELGTLVHIDLPEKNSKFSKGDSLVNKRYY
jgi:glycine cleavage system H lipoate-binding protein